MVSGRVSQQPPEQLAWLESRFAEFSEKQEKNTLSLFWSKMERDWFREWPIEGELGMPIPQGIRAEEGEAEVEVAPVSDADMLAIGNATAARKKKLRGWFNNRSQKVKNKGGAKGAAQLGEVAAVLFQGGSKKTKRTRSNHAVELFQKRFPQLVEDEMQKAGINNTEFLLTLVPKTAGGGSDGEEDGVEKDVQERLKSARLKLRREVTRRLFDALDEEVRSEFESEAQELKVAVKKKVQVEDSDDEDPKEPAERTPEQYQSEIEALPGVLREVHAAIERLTGWKGATILGGPIPAEGGKIMSKTFCFGVSPAGNTLVQAIPEWDSVITKKMGAWLSRCNPSEIRKARAIQKTGAVTGLASTSTSAPVPGSDSGINEAVVAPKKVRKRKAPKKTTTTARTASVTAPEYQRGATPEMEEQNDLGSDELHGDMDLEDRNPNIDPLLLGLTSERMTNTDTATGDSERTSAISSRPTRPIPRGKYKGADAAAAAAPSEAPAGRMSSDLVDAFGEAVREPSVEPLPLDALFEPPELEVEGPRWRSPLSPRIWAKTPTPDTTPTRMAAASWTPPTTAPGCLVGMPNTSTASPPPPTPPTPAPPTPIAVQQPAAPHPPPQTLAAASSAPLANPAAAAAVSATPVARPAPQQMPTIPDANGVASSPAQSPPRPPIASVSSGATTSPNERDPPRAGLTWNNFPQSRPLANAPKAPSAPKPILTGTGKAKGKGKENPAEGPTPTIPRKRKAADAFLQTYDDAGNVVPLDPGAAGLEVVSRKRKKEIMQISKNLDREKEVGEALKEKCKQLLANPDGNYPAVIWVPPPAELPEKRKRKAPTGPDGRPVVAWEAKRSRGELRSA
ncbi:hypothetical protein C8J57DRAFT_1542585 [Mycena rebaudengoi]|nr:hypothetical protein C8J57DRAFT_1542585 [Mycena rebaudengoi]